MAEPHGTFGWYELMTTDTEAAGKFYSDVVGWTTEDVGMPSMPYTTFNVGGAGVAGLMTLPPEAGPVPAWIGYIHVADVDAHSQMAVDAGGSLHKGPTDVPGMLRFAVMSDPEGAPFVLFTSNTAMGPPKRPAFGSTGTVGWCELLANDMDSAFSFYSNMFGWTKGEAHPMGAMGAYQTFLSDGVPTGGMMTRPPGLPGPFWTHYFMVDSVEAAADRIKAGGGSVVHGPMPVPGDSWIVQGVDPQGAAFALNSRSK